MATIRSIAQAAQVSRGTVDKVLNNRPGVSQEVRDKIQKIAEDLGYKPNLAGKALAFQKKDVRIGIVVPSAADEFFMQVFEGIRQGISDFSSFGIQFEVEETFLNTAEQQLNSINRLRDKTISGLMINPFDDDQVRAALLELKEQNIPVITFNSDLSGIGRLCYVGQDSKKSGRVAGLLMHKLLPQGGAVVGVTGTAVFKSIGDRLTGFRNYLKTEAPNLTVSAVFNNDNKKEVGYQQLSDYLQHGNPCDGVFITGSGVDGVVRAVQQYGKPGIKVICYDMLPSTKHLIQQGWIDFSILQGPFEQGYQPIKLLVDLLFYEHKFSDKHQFTRIDIRTKENLD